MRTQRAPVAAMPERSFVISVGSDDSQLVPIAKPMRGAITGEGKAGGAPATVRKIAAVITGTAGLVHIMMTIAPPARMREAMFSPSGGTAIRVAGLLRRERRLVLAVVQRCPAGYADQRRRAGGGAHWPAQRHRRAQSAAHPHRR